MGDFFNCFPATPEGRKIAVGGLGAGTMICYAAPQDQWVFYEIDPVMKSVAYNPKYFTYLSEFQTDLKVVLGDARLALAKAPNHYFDAVIIDAFSSDSIPVHLLTREALQSYLVKLKPGGSVVFHISNAHLRLDQVVARLARDAGLTALMRQQEPNEVIRQATRLGALPSSWVALAKTRKTLAA